jgi:hypothetical protein
MASWRKVHGARVADRVGVGFARLINGMGRLTRRPHPLIYLCFWGPWLTTEARERIRNIEQ